MPISNEEMMQRLKAKGQTPPWQKQVVLKQEMGDIPKQQKPLSTFGLWQTLGSASKKVSNFFGDAGKAYRDFNVGAVKGVGSTLAGVASFGEKALNTATEKLFPEIGVKGSDETVGSKLQEGVLKPEGAAQKAGFGTEQIAEFMVPVGAASKAAAVEKVGALASKAPQLTKAAEVGTKAVLEGGEQALRTAAQEGDINKEVGIAGVLGAGSQIAGKIVEKGLSKLGDSLFALAVPSTILERGKDLRKQINIGEAVSGTGISLTRKKFIEKIGGRINSLGQDLDNLVNSATKKGVGTNFDEIAELAIKNLDDAKLAKEIQASPIDVDDAKVVIKETIEKYKAKFGGREMNAEELQQLKRDLGKGLVKTFDRSMGAPIKAKSLTETKLYGQLDSFLDENISGYKQLNEKLAPLLEGKERLMKKGNYSGLLTDVIAGSVIGGTGGSLLEDPVGFLKGAVYGVLLKRGVQSTAAKTMAGTIAKQVGKAMSDPKFYQWFRQVMKANED